MIRVNPERPAGGASSPYFDNSFAHTEVRVEPSAERTSAGRQAEIDGPVPAEIRFQRLEEENREERRSLCEASEAVMRNLPTIEDLRRYDTGIAAAYAQCGIEPLKPVSRVLIPRISLECWIDP